MIKHAVFTSENPYDLLVTNTTRDGIGDTATAC
jgi:hypothetical protein